MKLSWSLALFECAVLFCAAASSSVFSVGSVSSEDPHACGPRSIGLLDGDTAKWVPGSCIEAHDWVDDAETATALQSGLFVVYANPGLGADTHFYIVNFTSKNVSKVLVGGDQGEMRCVIAEGRPSCYGVSPGDGDGPTQLIEVDALNGDSSPVLNLTDYEGFSVGGSVIDPDSMLYHFIAVGDPHLLAPPTTDVVPHPSSIAASRSRPDLLFRRCKRGARCPPPPSSLTVNGTEPSDQWLVTVDLKRMAVVAEAPLSRNFMGPLSVSESHGLATFNAEGYNGLVAVDYKSGKLQPLFLLHFDSIVQFCGAFSRNSVFVASAYPSPTRFYSVRLPSRGAVQLVANATFESSGVVFAAAW